MGSTVRCYEPNNFTVECYTARIFTVNCYIGNYSQELQHILDTK